MMLLLQNVWRRKARTALVLASVALGVASLLAMGIATQSTLDTLTRLVTELAGRESLVVQSRDLGGTLPPSVLRKVQETTQVQIAAPVVHGDAMLLGKGHTKGLSIVGVDWTLDPQVRTYQVTQGTLPPSNAGAIVPQALARAEGLSVDSNLDIEANGKEISLRVTGLLADRGAGHWYGGQAVIVSLPAAQDIFGRGASVDEIDLVMDSQVARDPTEVNQLKSKLQADIGLDYNVTLPSAGSQVFSDMILGLQAALLALGMTVLLTAALLVYNVFSMTIIERIREIGLMRAVGFTRGQTVSMILGEAFLLGALGDALGMAAGPLLAIPLLHLMTSNIKGTEGFVIGVTPAWLIISPLAGLLTVLGAALMPALKASRISPMEAVRARATSDTEGPSRWGRLIGLGLLTLAIICTALRVTLPPGVTGLALLLGVTLLIPTLVGPLEGVLRIAIQKIYGNEGALGSANLQRQRGRTALAISTVMIGVSLFVIVETISAGFQKSMTEWVTASLGGDFFIRQLPDGSNQYLAMDSGLENRIRAVSGVGAVVPMRELVTRLVGITRPTGFQEMAEQVPLWAVRPDAASNLEGFRLLPGQGNEQQVLQQFATERSVLLPVGLADRYHVEPGDSIRLKTADDVQDFTVAGLVESFWESGRAILISWTNKERFYHDRKADIFVVQVAPGASTGAVRTALESTVGQRNHLTIDDGGEFRAQMMGELDRVLALFYAVVVVALLVAILSVATTMIMNVLERVQELGILRALGMLPGQVVKMVSAEVAAIGLIGGLLGIGIGVLVSMFTGNGVRRLTGFSISYQFPGSLAVAAAVIALVATQVAALYSINQALRVNIVQAVQAE